MIVNVAIAREFPTPRQNCTDDRNRLAPPDEHTPPIGSR
jgi:hypothetical protein